VRIVYLLPEGPLASVRDWAVADFVETVRADDLDLSDAEFRRLKRRLSALIR